MWFISCIKHFESNWLFGSIIWWGKWNIKYINIDIYKTSLKLLVLLFLFCLLHNLSHILKLITHSDIIKEALFNGSSSTRAKLTGRLEHFSKATFFLLFETSLICSLFHVCYVKYKAGDLVNSSWPPVVWKTQWDNWSLGPDTSRETAWFYWQVEPDICLT